MMVRLWTILLTVTCFLPLTSPAAPSSPALNRPTSEPYQGDLAIFEGAKRAQHLEVARGVDRLGIRAGKAGAGLARRESGRKPNAFRLTSPTMRRGLRSVS